MKYMVVVQAGNASQIVAMFRHEFDAVAFAILCESIDASGVDYIVKEV